MHNFLDPKLLPKVATDAASTEKYEASNLISENFLVKSRGFIAFTAIKPPIDVDFELLCPISISYIALSTVVGMQKTTGVEIFVKNGNSQFVSICQAIYSEPGVVFCNSRFYSKNVRPENTENLHLAFFRANLFRAFTSASVIKVRIIRTERSIPCLGGVEIWGRIAKTCSKVTANTIQVLLNKDEAPPNVTATGYLKSQEIEDFSIPDDFKDALTYEIMAIPMTLPSGNSVDKSTLEKCMANDASQGRHGCDPFTGLRFTETRKPVLNAALKSRIDMFLMLNSNCPETFDARRTLGRSTRNSDLNSVAYYNEVVSSKRVKKEDVKDDSLEQAVNRMLNSDGFMRFTSDDTVENCDSKQQCVVCNINDNLYILPCEHVCCRKCLLEMCVQLECKTCGNKFSKSDPKKFHT